MENIDDNIDISGLDRAEVIAALANEISTGVDTKINADYVRDYLSGRLDAPTINLKVFNERPMYLMIDGDSLLRADLYEREAGHGKAKEVIDRLRKAKAAKP
jgi:hypothetical protein